MKINFKHVATAALAVAMSLSLAAPAFAEGNGNGGNKTLTVTGDTLDNKKVYAVQMFDARVTEGANNTFDNYEMVNSENWLKFFTAGTEAGGMGLTDQNNDSNIDADDARAYLEKMGTESTAVKTFADKAQAWVRNHSTDFTVINSDTEKEPVADQETFSNLKPGYYLVYPEGGSTGTENRGTDAMLVNVPRDNDAVLNIKSTFPTVDKKVDTNITEGDNHGDATDNGSAQVGDTVTFTLKSTVPDMSDYSTFYFAFNDTMSDGLQFVQKQPNPETVDANDVTVTIEGVTVSTGDYTASLTGNKLSVVFNNLQSVPGADVGDEIVVTYQAMITEAAATTNTATNTVEVEYSNNPKEETTGTSTPDESTVYTYEINVHKWSTESGGNDAYLEGAVFALSKESDLGTLSISTAEGDTNGKVVNDKGVSVENSLIGLTGSTNAYKIDPESNVYTFATTGSGAIKIQGLEAGTYYLYEVTAPASYNKLKEPVKIEIVVAPVSGNPSTNDATFETPVYIVTIDGVMTTGEVNDSTIDVENKKGITLPETGSIGTIGLTVAGVAIVLLGVFAPRKKKKSNQE